MSKINHCSSLHHSPPRYIAKYRHGNGALSQDRLDGGRLRLDASDVPAVCNAASVGNKVRISERRGIFDRKAYGQRPEKTRTGQGGRTDCSALETTPLDLMPRRTRSKA